MLETHFNRILNIFKWKTWNRWAALCAAEASGFPQSVFSCRGSNAEGHFYSFTKKATTSVTTGRANNRTGRFRKDTALLGFKLICCRALLMLQNKNFLFRDFAFISPEWSRIPQCPPNLPPVSSQPSPSVLPTFPVPSTAALTTGVLDFDVIFLARGAAAHQLTIYSLRPVSVINQTVRPTDLQQGPHYQEREDQPSQSAELKKHEHFPEQTGSPNELSRVSRACPCTHSNTLWLMYVRRGWTEPKCPACKSLI